MGSFAVRSAASDTDKPPVRDIPSRIAWALLALGFLLFFFVLPHTIEGDGRLRFEALQGWLDGQGISDTKYRLIGSLPSIPFMLLGHIVASPEWWVSRYNVAVYAAGVALLYWLLRGRIANDVLYSFLLLLGTTGMLTNSLTGFGAETFTAMAVGTGLVAWSIGHWKTGAVVLGLGVANQPASLVGLIFALGWWGWRMKQIRAFVPIVLAAGLWLAENILRRKSFLSTGYGNDRGFQTLLPYSGMPGFSYPTFFGVLSLLFSSGKGILFFTPGLVLVFRRGLDELRSVREILILWALFLAGMVVVYGSWWAWYGGFTWGPRFLIVASLPASLLLAAQVRRPPRSLAALIVVLAVLMLSLWVGIDGQAFGRYAQGACAANRYALESICWYVPEFSVLWTPFVFQAPLTLQDAVLIAYAVAVTVYVAYPLLRRWSHTAYGDMQVALAAYRGRAPWRF